MLLTKIQSALRRELASFRRCARAGDDAGAWRALERAHVLSQPLLLTHFGVHGTMLRFAWQCRDAGEVAGQLLRLALAPIGSLIGRIPRGNIGRARVSAFAAMPVPQDLAALLDDAS